MKSFRSGKVFICNTFAGIISEYEDGYKFTYDSDYIKHNAKAVSLTMPLKEESYTSSILFPFFDGLIPEGYLLNITANNWKLSLKDRFGILLVACKDPIGNVSIEEEK